MFWSTLSHTSDRIRSATEVQGPSNAPASERDGDAGETGDDAGVQVVRLLLGLDSDDQADGGELLLIELRPFTMGDQK